MPTVDPHGRIVLPQRVRERLGISAGSEVEISVADGRAVVEPVEDTEDLLTDLMDRIDATAAVSEPVTDTLDPQSRAHVDAIRRQARESEPSE